MWVESTICVSVDLLRAASALNSRSHTPRGATSAAGRIPAGSRVVASGVGRFNLLILPGDRRWALCALCRDRKFGETAPVRRRRNPKFQPVPDCEREAQGWARLWRALGNLLPSGDISPLAPTGPPRCDRATIDRQYGRKLKNTYQINSQSNTCPRPGIDRNTPLTRFQWFR